VDHQGWAASARVQSPTSARVVGGTTSEPDHPHIAIEIVHTAGGIDKLAVYQGPVLEVLAGLGSAHGARLFLVPGFRFTDASSLAPQFTVPSRQRGDSHLGRGSSRRHQS
jgi:hypothetical protein